MNSGTTFLRALFAFLALPGIVAGVVPVLIASADTKFQVFSALGFVPLALGLVLLLWCVHDFFVSGKGTLAPWDPPKHLVVAGLYRYVRNPMYLAVVTIVSGWGLTFGSLWVGLYLIALAIGFHLRVVRYEESWLDGQFGTEWRKYSASVRRWLPRLGLKTSFFILILVLLALIATSAVVGHPEPSYQGRSLSKWLSELALDPAVSQNARRAVRTIGTNALPRLSAMVRATDPGWKRAVIAINAKQHLLHIAFTPAGIMRSDAVEGYRALGGLAKDNVPVLVRLLDSEPSVQVRSSIAQALGAIGPEAKAAIPALAKAANEKDLQLRLSATSALMNIQSWTDPADRLREFRRN